MIKASRFPLFKQFYSFSQASLSYQKPIDFTVSKIISYQKRDHDFVYRHTKQVCQTISTLFEGLPQNQYRNIHELKNLMNNVHLSVFSSWKALRQTSFTIEKVLNKLLAQRKQKIQQSNLILLLNVLSELNYELETTSDRMFIYSQIFPVVFDDSLNLNIEKLKTIEALSSHSGVYGRIFEEKKDFHEQIMNLAEKCVDNQGDEFKNYLVSNIIKNGIYQNRWSSQFLQFLRVILSKHQNLQMNLKGLLNAIQLNSPRSKCIEQDQWSLSQLQNKETNILTEIGIVNIVKSMDYDVQANQSLFNYEVDAKIGNNFIIEYHGIHHYRTNTKKPIETKKSHWKAQSLKNRGYKVFIIPFYSWNKLQTPYQKKAWLIENLENHFLTQSI